MNTVNRMVLDVSMAELNKMTTTEQVVDQQVGNLTLRDVKGLMSIMPEGSQKNDAIAIIEVFEGLTVADLFSLANRYKDGEKLSSDEEEKVKALLAAKVDLQYMSAKVKH